MKERISIPYFDRSLKFASPLIVGLSIFLFTKGLPIVGAILLMATVIIFTTSYVTEIDLSKKVYNDYLLFVGLKLNNESYHFKTAHRIVITKGSYCQNINTRSRSTSIQWSDYTATLLFDDDHPLPLLTCYHKRELLIGILRFSKLLDVGVEDGTTPQHFWIDMDKLNEDL